MDDSTAVAAASVGGSAAESDAHRRAVRLARQGALLIVLFAVSGLTGLVYESIWARYLKLFLGHAAYAQTLVLVIFMGGMTLGAWLASRVSARLSNLLLVYAALEGILGVAGIAFHGVFDAGMHYVESSLLPGLESGAAVAIVKWGLAAALIAPQSVLLGMTFPVLSSAFVRRFPRARGISIANLYFANSAGATAGVLLSGYLLVPRLGLPGAVLTAGLLNVLLAVAVYGIAKNPDWSTPTPPSAKPDHTVDARGLWHWMLTAAFVTGVASFLYEIAWIRLLSLVLGASTHAFELMLAAFIAGLALGSLWIRSRIGRIADPVGFLGKVQVVMGVCALGSLVVYGHTFELMAMLLDAVSRTDTGYNLFNLSSQSIALLVMLPATFCAGTTLPLATHVLLRAGFGEASIGRVYAANTAGAIVAVVLALHVFMPLVGLKGLLVLGAILDVGLGLVLLYRVVRTPRAKGRNAYAIAGAGAVVATVLFVQLDPNLIASGVYRTGESRLQDAEITFHRDGKTSTVNLANYENGFVSLSVNGKPDGTLHPTRGAEPDPDEMTMTLLGVIPLATRPQASSAAVVGLGTGMTTHVLLGSPNLERVDTVEIEAAIVEASQLLGERVSRAHTDPRSHIHIDDARGYFFAGGRRYDIIVSEPSNPWVSGVSSLYTPEFYELVAKHLERDGIFAQWMHVYELSPALFESVIKALSSVFGDYVLYNLNDRDVLIVAAVDGGLELDVDAAFEHPMLAAELEMIEVHSPQDLLIRKIGSKRVLDPWFHRHDVAANSSYFPVLDLNAVRARFMRDEAVELIDLGSSTLPVLEMLDAAVRDVSRTEVSYNPYIDRVGHTLAAMAVRDHLIGESVEVPVLAGRQGNIPITVSALAGCAAPDGDDARTEARFRVATLVIPYLHPRELEQMWERVERHPCAASWSPRDVHWLALLKAVSNRDGAAMARIAEEILHADTGLLEATHVDYLVATAMLGHLSQGRSSHARAVRERYTSMDASDPNAVLTLQFLNALSR